MNEPTNAIPGLVEIICPFCNQLLVQEFDLSLIDSDSYDSLPDPVWEIDCPHVAAYGVWGLVDAEIMPSWQAQIAPVFEQMVEEEEVNDVDDFISAVSEKSSRARALLQECLPGHEIVDIHEYVECGAGPRGGGPTFNILLVEGPSVAS